MPHQQLGLSNSLQILSILLLVAINTPAVAQNVACAPAGRLNFGASESVTDTAATLILRGGAWICFRGTLITASSILFDRQTGTGTASGGVQLRDTKGNVTTAQQFSFSQELNTALAAVPPGQ